MFAAQVLYKYNGLKTTHIPMVWNWFMIFSSAVEWNSVPSLRIKEIVYFPLLVLGYTNEQTPPSWAAWFRGLQMPHGWSAHQPGLGAALLPSGAPHGGMQRSRVKIRPEHLVGSVG